MPKGIRGFQKGHRLWNNENSKKNWFQKGNSSWNRGKVNYWAKGELNPMHRIEVKKKISIKVSGENNGNWKGGIYPINEKIRDSLDYKLWRKSVFERDNYTCQNCGARSGKNKAIFLEAHHIKSFSKNVELRFDISNGIALCQKCHNKTKNGKYTK